MSPLLAGWNEGRTFNEQTMNQGRYGVAYLASVCAHFGVKCVENPPDSDAIGIDATIGFRAGETRVQVKCTTQEFSSRSQTIRIPVKPEWVSAWRENKLPTYLLVVRVPKELASWIDYDLEDATGHAAAAYWARLDEVAEDARSVSVSRHNRFTPETLRDWNQELMGGYGAR